ncbi:cyanoexosortase A system-associated protein [Pseudanabaena biceps]|nr:cyanoexosortase A system-associated protein [Pseudanabaena biceps]
MHNSQKYSVSKSRLHSLQSLKKILLIVITVSTSIAIVVSVLTPKSANLKKYQFPNNLVLKDLQLKASNNLDNLNETNIGGAWQYIYTSPNQKTSSKSRQEIQIDIVYTYTVISLPRSLSILNIKHSEKPLDIKYANNIGYYTLFTDQKRAYLASCINPRGEATVTEKQFTNNRDKYDFSIDKLGLYLIGKSDLRDNRCLFTVMSTSLENNTSQISNSVDNTYQTLETSWKDWYIYWKNKFPET